MFLSVLMLGVQLLLRGMHITFSACDRMRLITVYLLPTRLLVGPINVVINDSSEPMEKNVKATIPELEAEILLMVKIRNTNLSSFKERQASPNIVV